LVPEHPQTLSFMGDLSRIGIIWTAPANGWCNGRSPGNIELTAAGQAWRPNQTLQPPGLVHEAYLQPVSQKGVDWRNVF
jgi:hypothetical protein